MTSSSLKLIQKRHLKSDQAWLVSHPSDVTYLTSFSILVPEEREALVLITSQKAFLIKQNFSPFTSQKLTILNNCTPPHLFKHCQQIVIQQNP